MATPVSPVPLNLKVLNSLAHGPCLVAAYLLAACNNGCQHIFVLIVEQNLRELRLYQSLQNLSKPSLLPQHSYIGPTGKGDGDLHKCNTVAYNLS